MEIHVAAFTHIIVRRVACFFLTVYLSHYFEIKKKMCTFFWRQIFSPFCSLNGTFSLNIWIKKLDSIEADRIWENPLKHKEKDELKLEKQKTLVAQTQEAERLIKKFGANFLHASLKEWNRNVFGFVSFIQIFTTNRQGWWRLKKTTKSIFFSHIQKEHLDILWCRKVVRLEE